MENQEKKLRTSKVLKCVFTREHYQQSIGKMIYYHDLELGNGDIGSCGRLIKYPEDMREGSIINYYMLDGNSIKFQADKGVRQNSGESGSSGSRPSRPPRPPKVTNKLHSSAPRNNKQDAYLGFSFSYAKDMVIAGKTSDADIANLDKIATAIYNRIGALMENPSSPTEFIAPPQPPAAIEPVKEEQGLGPELSAYPAKTGHKKAGRPRKKQ